MSHMMYLYIQFVQQDNCITKISIITYEDENVFDSTIVNYCNFDAKFKVATC